MFTQVYFFVNVQLDVLRKLYIRADFAIKVPSVVQNRYFLTQTCHLFKTHVAKGTGIKFWDFLLSNHVNSAMLSQINFIEHKFILYL